MYKEPTKEKKTAATTKKETATSEESLQLKDERTAATTQRKVQRMMRNYIPKHVIQPKLYPEKAVQDSQHPIENAALTTHSVQKDFSPKKETHTQLKSTDNSKDSDDNSVIQRQIIPYNTNYKGPLTA
ncbi:MAG: hypothetical protein AAF617_17965, partial [Bacteroidota bacterium]